MVNTATYFSFFISNKRVYNLPQLLYNDQNHVPFSCSCTRNSRLCSLGLVMCDAMYGYCGGSKFGLHQLPIMSSISQSCFTFSCLPNVCKSPSNLDNSVHIAHIYKNETQVLNFYKNKTKKTLQSVQRSCILIHYLKKCLEICGVHNSPDRHLYFTYNYKKLQPQHNRHFYALNSGHVILIWSSIFGNHLQ